jgi:GntR family transcriptional regulator
MFVAAGAADRLRSAERREFLDNRWPGIVSHMRRLGLEPEDLIERALA